WSAIRSRSGHTKSEGFGLSINNLGDGRRAGMALQALRVAEAIAVISHFSHEPWGKLGRDLASVRRPPMNAGRSGNSDHAALQGSKRCQTNDNDGEPVQN